jgi:hypothetical protein
MKKTIRVTTSDPERKDLQLFISGKVDRLVTIKPRRVRLEGLGDAALQATVTIKTEPKYPMRILSATPRNEGFITSELARNEAEDQYVITVKNIRKKAGRYVDTIEVTTDSDLRPGFKIYVYGMIKEPASPKKE